MAKEEETVSLLESPIVVRLLLPMAADDFVSIVKELAKRYDNKNQRLFVHAMDGPTIELRVEYQPAAEQEPPKDS